MELLSGAPYWPIQNGLIASYAPVVDDLTCDVAVVGGGISGACVAYELTRAGANVVVLDRRDVATGSTAGSTSLLQYELDTPLTALAARWGEAAAGRAYRLCADAIAQVEAYASLAADRCGFRRCTSFYGATGASDVAGLRAEAAARRRCGLPVQFWDRARVQRESSLPFHAALYSTLAGQVDAHRLTHVLLRAAVRGGARVHDRTMVRDYVHGSRGVVLHTDRGPRVRARRVVIAAGYEADSLLDDRASRLRTTFAAVSEPIPDLDPWLRRRLVWETARPYFYLRATEDRRLLIGGEDEPFMGHLARTRVLPAKVRRLLRHFRRYFPRVDFEPAYVWAGAFAETKDGLPFIGVHRSFPRAWFALGYGGNGITFAALAARLIRGAYVGKPIADAALFRFHR